MRALILEPQIYTPDLICRLEMNGITCVTVDCLQQSDLLSTLSEASKSGQSFNVIFARLGFAFDEEVFRSAGSSLKLLVTPTTGLSHIDMGAAERYHINVLSLKPHTAFLRTVTSTAEHSWALLLSLLRRVPHAYEDVVDGNWVRDPYRGVELYGKTLGIWGLGRLGSLVAGYGRAFMMKVIAYDVRDSAFADQDNSHVERVDLSGLLCQSDVLSIHLPLNTENVGILDRDKLVLMKKNAILINTSRGELIDEDALLDCLNSEQLGGVALDVLNDDAIWNATVPEQHPLIAYSRTHRNALITPHIGGYTHEATYRTRSFMIDRFLEWLDEDN